VKNFPEYYVLGCGQIRGDSRPLISSKNRSAQRIDTNIKLQVQIRRICPFALFANLI